MHKQIRQILVAAVVLGATMPAYTQDDDEVVDVVDEVGDRDATCISLRNVRRTDAIDDRNILYYMRGGTVYHNILPRQCGGLARENRFSYRTTMGRLCSMDSITVMYDGPFGLDQGNSCQLGRFHKITREDAKSLKEGPANEPIADPLPMPPPQEIGAEQDEPEDPEDPDTDPRTQ